MAAPLPIDAYVPAIVEHARARRAVIVTAAPGAGKTTRVPPALSADGATIVLQPRRIAARSIARRIADEQGWTVGREVGWHVRFEREFSAATTLLLATEGILTARLQQDPLLTGFRTVVLDEFHERSIHADLGIALIKQAWLARDDLRVVVMSATLDADRAAAFLGGCPVVHVPGRLHPIEIGHRTDASVADAVRDALQATPGHVLCFLAGAPEIRREQPIVQQSVGAAIDVVPLHGSLPPAAQDAAIAPSSMRRVILATNIAETSLTVPGVTAVVDTGLHKVARYDPDRGIDSLETERISRDAADQRAGRAGREGRGVVRRLWSEATRLRPHREPDILRVDLSGPLLDVIAWGADPRSFEWFETPSDGAIDAGLELLRRLGAIDGVALTPLGRRMAAVPLHPRLGRILLDSDGARPLALACALLSERHYLPPRHESTSSDLLAAVEAERDLPPHVLRTARDLERFVRASGRGRPDVDEAGFRRALLAGYPDRVGRRRAAGSPRVLLSTGHGAVVGPESGVREGDYLVALDVQAGRRGEGSEARIRIASRVEREWLKPTSTRLEHVFDPAAGIVRAFRRHYHGAIVLTEQPEVPDPSAAAALLTTAFTGRPLSVADEQLIRRIRFAGIDVEIGDLVQRAAMGCRSLAEIDLGRNLPRDVRQRMDRDAPSHLSVPSGRSHPLRYEEDGSVSASVKLQELFGLADTPRLGPRSVPVVLVLLAPNGRAVQTTTDLRSFWDRTYAQVRRELRGRYPRHPWPEDPWNATPTARTTRRMKPS